MKTAALLLASLMIAAPAVAKEKPDFPKFSGNSVTGYRITTRETYTHIPPRPNLPGRWFLSCSRTGRVQTCTWFKS